MTKRHFTWALALLPVCTHTTLQEVDLQEKDRDDARQFFLLNLKFGGSIEGGKLCWVAGNITIGEVEARFKELYPKREERTITLVTGSAKGLLLASSTEGSNIPLSDFVANLVDENVFKLFYQGLPTVGMTLDFYGEKIADNWAFIRELKTQKVVEAPMNVFFRPKDAPLYRLFRDEEDRVFAYNRALSEAMLKRQVLTRLNSRKKQGLEKRSGPQIVVQELLGEVYQFSDLKTALEHPYPVIDYEDDCWKVKYCNFPEESSEPSPTSPAPSPLPFVEDPSSRPAPSYRDTMGWRTWALFVLGSVPLLGKLLSPAKKRKERVKIDRTEDEAQSR